MTHDQIKARFPNASKSFIEANCPRQDTVVEQAAGNDALGPSPREEKAAGKLLVRFTSFRQRLCDPDNLCIKHVLDCLRYCGAIPGDEPEKITLEVRQEKVALKSDERTEIAIFYDSSRTEQTN